MLGAPCWGTLRFCILCDPRVRPRTLPTCETFRDLIPSRVTHAAPAKPARPSLQLGRGSRHRTPLEFFPSLRSCGQAGHKVRGSGRAPTAQLLPGARPQVRVSSWQSTRARIGTARRPHQVQRAHATHATQALYDAAAEPSSLQNPQPSKRSAKAFESFTHALQRSRIPLGSTRGQFPRRPVFAHCSKNAVASRHASNRPAFRAGIWGPPLA